MIASPLSGSSVCHHPPSEWDEAKWLAPESLTPWRLHNATWALALLQPSAITRLEPSFLACITLATFPIMRLFYLRYGPWFMMVCGYSVMPYSMSQSSWVSWSQALFQGPFLYITFKAGRHIPQSLLIFLFLVSPMSWGHFIFGLILERYSVY